MIKLAKSIRDEYGIGNLCLAGGVALNCVANGKILNQKIFEEKRKEFLKIATQFTDGHYDLGIVINQKKIDILNRY